MRGRVFKEVGGREHRIHKSRATAYLKQKPVVDSFDFFFSLLFTLFTHDKINRPRCISLGVGHIQCKTDRVTFCCNTLRRETCLIVSPTRQEFRYANAPSRLLFCLSLP